MKNILIVLLILFVSCTPLKHVVESEGQIIAQVDNNFLLIFRDVSQEDVTYTWNWVYFPDFKGDWKKYKPVIKLEPID